MGNVNEEITILFRIYLALIKIDNLTVFINLRAIQVIIIQYLNYIK